MPGGRVGEAISEIEGGGMTAFAATQEGIGSDLIAEWDYDDLKCLEKALDHGSGVLSQWSGTNDQHFN